MTTSDIAYKTLLAHYRQTLDSEIAVREADEIRKVLAVVEGEERPKTRECRAYRAWILECLHEIVDIDGSVHRGRDGQGERNAPESAIDS